MEDNNKLESPLEKISVARFTGHTMPVSYTVSVSDIPVRVLQNNPNRVYALLQNIGESDVSIGFDDTTNYDEGIRIFSAGGAASLDYRTDGETVGYEMYGVCATGQSTVIRVYSVSVI